MKKSMPLPQFPPAVAREVGHYVYLYVDPRNGEIFYVGKGAHNRCFSHLLEKSETEKTARIADIRAAGLQPAIEILVHGVDDETSLRVEAAVIDLLDVGKLTNQVKGHKSGKYGRMPVEKMTSLYAREAADIAEPSVLFKLSRSFVYAMTAQERYDATRQFWSLGADREKAKFAFAVFDNTVQEVYEITGWYAGGSTFTTREVKDEHKDKWEFVGKIADDNIRKKYLHKDVSHLVAAAQNPVRYVNIK